MARKKRIQEPVSMPEQSPNEPNDKAPYQDTFQRTVNEKVENLGGMLEGQGKNILYGIAALAVLGIIILMVYAWSGRTSAEAQTYLGKAIETSEAVITETPPLTPGVKSFKTHKERAEAAINEFQVVVDKFGGAAGEKAKYFIAVQRMFIDKDAATAELRTLSETSGESGVLSKFLLAQIERDAGKYDVAAKLLQELIDGSNTVVSKDTLKLELVSIYEKQDKKQEAIDLLFALVKEASERKDLDGKAVPLSGALMDAKDKLTELAPEKAKELPEQQIESPFGASNPFGN